MGWEIAAGLAIMLVLFYYHVNQRYSKEPQMWPLVGMLTSLIFHFDNFYEWATDILIRNGGTVRIKGPWLNKVATADPANIEYVLKTRFQNFIKGDHLRSIFCDVFGEASVFLADGQTWRTLRTTVSAIFASASVRNDVIRTTPELVHARLLPLIRQASDKGSVIDLQDVFLRFAFDSISIIGLGFDSMSLRNDLGHIPFAEAYDRATDICMFRMLVPAFWWKTLRYLGIGMERRLRQDRRIIDEYIAEIVSVKKKEIENNIVADGSRSFGVMPFFLRLEKEMNGRAYSNQDLRDIYVNLIMAGRDTTSAALTWFFWAVQRHPLVEERILMELQQILKRRTSIEIESRDRNSDPGPFTVEEVKKMQYLQAALSESLRLYPSAPIEVSEAAEDDVLPDGTRVQKGSNVLLMFYSTGRMERIWGKDCREFKPERWLRNGKFLSETEFKYPVFNAGPRRCSGKDFAYLQMKWLAASILLRYRVKQVRGHRAVPKFGMMLGMEHGLPVTFHQR
eukprot:Gb_16065 [translate_table: standard]